MCEETLFHETRDRSPADRAAFLDANCTDTEMRLRIEALLKAHDEPGGVLDQPAVTASFEDEPGATEAPPAADEQPGTLIGPYRLMQKLGEGGMGTVWVAEQSAPIKRRVALKLIKAGMDSRGVLRRFEAERQALALMTHQFIAKVLDAGATAEGRPFFVMELVIGVPLTKFCDETKLDIRGRLELFVPICQAVQHAHQKGIVHRDLKPSNILVTLADGRPIPKIIDFGVAKATGGKLIDETIATLAGEVVGTLEYMSPEQASFSAADVDTRADIYSLGVILYELLTGLKPFDRRLLKNAAFDELIRIIREEDPSKPSTRLSADELLPSLAAARQIEPARLTKLLRGELDSVVMKCLEKQRDRRYVTANSLARDIQRYLADETVEARPPSVGDRLQKMLRRNRRLVLAASLVFLTLIGGIAGTTLGMFEAKRQEDRAIEAMRKESERATSEAKARGAEQIEREKAETQETLANDRAAKLQSALASSYFRQGIREYDAGRPNSALADLTRALAMTPTENPLYASYRRVLIDRSLQGGKQLLPPLWHAGPVTAAAFSPDGTRIVTGSRDKTARLWDATTGAPIGKPMQHERAVVGVAFSPDGTRVMTRSGSVARLWSASSGAPVGAVMEHADAVSSAAFSPDGRYVITGSFDKTARLWDAQSGAPFAAVMRHDSPVYCVAFSPDGRRVVTGTGIWLETGVVQLWDAQTGNPVGNAMRHANNIVWSVVFSADGKLLLTGSQDWTVRVWDAQSGAFVGPTIQSDCPVGNAIFSPDGTRILMCDGPFAGYFSYLARLWDARTGASVGTVMNHEGHVSSMAFSPDGARVLTASKASQGYAARLWDANTGAPIGEPMKHQGNVAVAAFSPDGTRVLTGSDDNTARLWSAYAGMPIGDDMPHLGFGTSVAFSPDGTRVVTGSAIPGGGRGNGTARLWDAHSGAPIGEVMKHEGRVWDVAFSPDGTRVVTGSGDYHPSSGIAQLWNAHTGVRVGAAMRHSAVVRQVVFSPDATRIATASTDGTARLWDAHSGAPLGSVMKHKEAILCLVFSPDGTRIATGSADETARLWDAHTGAPIGEAMRHQSDVSSVDFSRDGTRVVTGSADRAARLWDAHTGAALGEVMKHEGAVNSVAVSPDGTRVVTGSADFTARLWDAHTGAPVGETMRHQSDVTSVAFSPDGTRIVTGDSASTSGGMVRLWDAHTGAPVGEVMANPCVQSLAFSPDGTRVVAGGWNAARLWDVTISDIEPHSTSGAHEILQLWTGFHADTDGTLHELTPAQLDQIRQQVGDIDPLRRFAAERWLRSQKRASREAERVAAWDARVSSALKDKQPKDMAERFALIQRAKATRRYVAATKLLSDALEANPKLADNRTLQHRYNAACYAALAGSGMGIDDPSPDEAARARLRKQSLGWLKAELEVWLDLVKSGNAREKPIAELSLTHWKQDADLVGVRDTPQLARLPEAERKEWQLLWAAVEDVLLTLYAGPRS